MNQHVFESLITAATQICVGAVAPQLAAGAAGGVAHTESVLDVVLAVPVLTKVRLGSAAASCVHPVSAQAVE